MQSTVAPSLDELVSSLGMFPQGVLPAGVIREIIGRGPEANAVLLARLEDAAQNAGRGIGSIPSESFFAFALLHTHADACMLPTIGRLYALGQSPMEEIMGDLIHDFSTSLIVRMADASNVDSICQWIDAMVRDPQIYEYANWNLVNVLKHLVARELLDRADAIAQLKCWLELRSGEKYDTLSTACVCELVALRGGDEVLPFLTECYERGQIDESIVGLEDCERVESIDELPDALQKNDLIEYFRGWHGFTAASDSLNPRDTTAHVTRESTRHPRRSITTQDANGWFDTIRSSTDTNYPADAVRMLAGHGSDYIGRLTDEVRWGLQQANESDRRTSNGPFIAATILAAQCYFPASDLFLEILDLPSDTRMDLFGDAIEPSIVAALSSSLLGDCDPIDERIDDPDRDELDRATLTLFYPQSAFHGYLPRKNCIDRLTQLMEKYVDGPSRLSGAIYDALCLMSVGEDAAVMTEAREQGVTNTWFSPEDAARCREHPDQARDVVCEQIRAHFSVENAIKGSVMFTSEALDPTKRLPVDASLPNKPLSFDDPRSTSTMEQTANHQPRNAPCNCGSGKKFKKCCGKR